MSAPPEVRALARKYRNHALGLAVAILPTFVVFPLLGLVVTLFALWRGLVAYGLWQGAWWALAHLPPGVQARGDVQGYFSAGSTCPWCSRDVLPGGRYCHRCGGAFVVDEPGLGQQVALAFARLFGPQPVEPARAQAYLLRPAHEASGKWLAVALVFVVAGMLLTSLLGFVEDLGVTLIVFAPPVLLLLWLRQQDRYEVEPLGLLALAFSWGILSGFFAGPLNSAIEFLLGLGGVQAGPVEEGLKALFVFTLAGHRTLRRELNGPVDGLVYGACVGLGFAAMENFAYVQGAFVQPWGEGALWLGALVRLSGVLAHATWAGLAGGFLGLMLLRHGRVTFRNYVAAVAPPATFHGLHNLLATLLPSQDLLIFLMAMPLLLGVSAFAFFKLLYEGQRDEVAWGYDRGKAPVERAA